MKFRPALLLSGVVLLAAVPVWADRIPYPEYMNDSSSKVASSSGPELNATGNAEFLSRAVSAIVLLDSSDISTGLDAWNSKPTAPLYALLPSSSFAEVQPVSLSGFSSLGIASSNAHAVEAMWIVSAGEEHGIFDPARHHITNPHSQAQLVPEPGSLGLTLIGLIALGFLSTRRTRLEKTA
jgi:hypothetical protein